MQRLNSFKMCPISIQISKAPPKSNYREKKTHGRTSILFSNAPSWSGRITSHSIFFPLEVAIVLQIGRTLFRVNRLFERRVEVLERNIRACRVVDAVELELELSWGKTSGNIPRAEFTPYDYDDYIGTWHVRYWRPVYSRVTEKMWWLQRAPALSGAWRGYNVPWYGFCTNYVLACTTRSREA